MRIPSLVRGVLDEEPGSSEFVGCTRALAEAAFSKDRSLAREATRAIFEEIVEPWSDSFNPDSVDAYVSFMSEVVYAPRSPVAAELGRLGFPGPRDLRERYQRIRKGLSFDDFDEEDHDGVRLVVILSRVTLGADIAVSSVFIRAAVHHFGYADVEFIAPRKNAVLLADGQVVQRRNFSYGRSTLLANRLKAWLRLRARIERSIAGLEPGEWLVIDPDSRLTQLGLLPVTDDRYYDFFESRSIAPDDPTPLGELAGSAWWMDFFNERHRLPYARLSSTDRTKGRYLRHGSDRLIAAVSFGVGGRETKRLGDEFEDALLEVLRRLGFRILLDYGGGVDEARLVDQRVASFRGSKSHLKTMRDGLYKRADLMTVRGSLGSFGGWMYDADIFVGYDSASAHLAAAHGVPVLEVFAGAPCKRFMQRWTPCGEERVCVIPADGPADGPDVLARLESELGALKDRGGRWGLID